MDKCLCTYIQFALKILGWIQLWQILPFMIYVRLNTFIGTLVRQDCRRWSFTIPYESRNPTTLLDIFNPEIVFSFPVFIL
jgi:hypothetical protein